MMDNLFEKYLFQEIGNEILSKEELKLLLKNTLPEKRYMHTLAVEKEAVYIASKICPEFTETISRAALLHDITKPLTLEQHTEIARRFGTTLCEDDLNSPQTVHSLTGSLYASRCLSENSIVAECIATHTTGKPQMTIPQMIVFLSDYIEETREYCLCRQERELFHNSFSYAVGYEDKLFAITCSVERILHQTVEYLKAENSTIHPKTLDALEYYKMLNKKEQNEKR